jgi:hypothetical protein
MGAIMQHIRYLFTINVVLMFVSALSAGFTAHKDTNYESGKVVVKLLPEYKYLATEQPSAAIGLPEADRTLEQLGAVKVSQRFRFDAKRLTEGVPDLSLILQIEYSKDISPYLSRGYADAARVL